MDSNNTSENYLACISMLMVIIWLFPYLEWLKWINCQFKINLKQNGNWMRSSAFSNQDKNMQPKGFTRIPCSYYYYYGTHVYALQKRLPLLTWISEKSCSNETWCELWMTAKLICMIWDAFGWIFYEGRIVLKNIFW